MKRQENRASKACSRNFVNQICTFILGCALTALFFLQTQFLLHQNDLSRTSVVALNQDVSPKVISTDIKDPSISSVLDGVKILVAVVAYDFSQIPHLEELLDSYFDLCSAGSKVDVVVYSTVPWPVTFIDLLNTRFVCTNPSPRAGFSITIHLKSPRLVLHLVDPHRELFYERLDAYDLFIYTEDDIRVSPKTVAHYITESKLLDEKCRLKGCQATDFNVGVVRYEYNFPPGVVIDDKTRHATQNVTRVYWEHSWHPPVPKAADIIPQHDILPGYVHMQNHHQGMYLATQDRLRAWKDKKGCEFNEIKNRPSVPGKPHQHSEGTQRVWMSSAQLYGKKHCGVQQVIPIDKFGLSTVLHLPNKNYRRVGRKGRLGGHDAKEAADTTKETDFTGPSDKLLGALQLHLEIRKQWPAEPQIPYRGIIMEDRVEGRPANSPLLIRRMSEYHTYVERGGVLVTEDFTKTALVEEN